MGIIMMRLCQRGLMASHKCPFQQDRCIIYAANWSLPVDNEPKKKRKKRPAIKTDPIRMRRHYENRARLRKYYDDVASGPVGDHPELTLKRDGRPSDPQEHLAYLKKGFDEGFPSARSMAAPSVYLETIQWSRG
jgi:hypothetical protein